jgi:hypothetical protein
MRAVMRYSRLVDAKAGSPIQLRQEGRHVKIEPGAGYHVDYTPHVKAQ